MDKQLRTLTLDSLAKNEIETRFCLSAGLTTKKVFSCQDLSVPVGYDVVKIIIRGSSAQVAETVLGEVHGNTDLFTCGTFDPLVLAKVASMAASCSCNGKFPM